MENEEYQKIYEIVAGVEFALEKNAIHLYDFMGNLLTTLDQVVDALLQGGLLSEKPQPIRETYITSEVSVVNIEGNLEIKRYDLYETQSGYPLVSPA